MEPFLKEELSSNKCRENFLMRLKDFININYGYQGLFNHLVINHHRYLFMIYIFYYDLCFGTPSPISAGRGGRAVEASTKFSKWGGLTGLMS